MTKLHEDFLTHLQLRGYAKSTIKNYIQAISLLAIRTYNIYFYSIKSFSEHFMPETNMTVDL